MYWVPDADVHADNESDADVDADEVADLEDGDCLCDLPPAPPALPTLLHQKVHDVVLEEAVFVLFLSFNYRIHRIKN